MSGGVAPVFRTVSSYVQGFPVLPPCYNPVVDSWIMTQNNSGTYQYSPDGQNWVTLNWPMGAKDWVKLLCVGGLFLAIQGINAAQSIYWSSPDGLNWTQRALPWASYWEASDVTNGLAILVPPNDGRGLLYSADGLNWSVSAAPLGEGHSMQGTCYGAGVWRTFNSTGNYDQYSYDLVNWTEINANRNFDTVPFFGNGVFVAGGGTLQWSADGQNWNNCVDQNGAILQNTDNLCFDAILGQFICVPYPDGRVYTSGDGKFFQLSLIPYPGAGSYRIVPRNVKPQAYVSPTGSGTNYGTPPILKGAIFPARNFTKIIQVQ